MSIVWAGFLSSLCWCWREACCCSWRGRGLNSQAANVACGQIGFEFGVVSPAGCAEYGGASFCGASGSPVAAKALQCAGTEMSLKECKHDAPDDACLSHASDSVVFCGTSTTGAFFDGELRLIGASGAPVLHTKSDDWKCIWLTHKLGRQSAGKGSPVARLRLLARRWVLLVLQGFLDAMRAPCAERCGPMFLL